MNALVTHCNLLFSTMGRIVSRNGVNLTSLRPNALLLKSSDPAAAAPAASLPRVSTHKQTAKLPNFLFSAALMPKLSKRPMAGALVT